MYIYIYVYLYILFNYIHKACKYSARVTFRVSERVFTYNIIYRNIRALYIITNYGFVARAIPTLVLGEHFCCWDCRIRREVGSFLLGLGSWVGMLKWAFLSKNVRAVHINTELKFMFIENAITYPAFAELYLDFFLRITLRLNCEIQESIYCYALYSWRILKL